MKAIMCRRLGGPEMLALEEVPAPVVGPGQVRLRLHAAGINFPDVLMVEGGYQHRPELPFVPGMEAAGEVLEVGAGVAGWRPGDRAIARLRPGAFQEEVLARPEQLLAMPDGLDFAEAACFVVGYLTAVQALLQRGRLAAGEVTLIHGAAGGVGLAAVDLAKRLGATVIATGGDDAKLAVVKRRGADHVLNYRDGPFREAVLALTGGRGADVIFDPVGGEVFRQSLRCIAWRGRLLVIGFAGGEIPELPTNYPLLKGCAVIGVRAGEHGRHDPESGRQATAAVLRLAAEGVRPHISHRLPLHRAGEALQLLRDRQVVGRAILTIP